MNIENVGRVLISILAVGAFFAYVAGILFIPVPSDMRDVINAAGGILGGAFVGVVNYWIGSSSGSASKDRTITSLTQPKETT